MMKKQMISHLAVKVMKKLTSVKKMTVRFIVIIKIVMVIPMRKAAMKSIRTTWISLIMTVKMATIMKTPK